MMGVAHLDTFQMNQLCWFVCLHPAHLLEVNTKRGVTAHLGRGFGLQMPGQEVTDIQCDLCGLIIM